MVDKIARTRLEGNRVEYSSLLHDGDDHLRGSKANGSRQTTAGGLPMIP